VIEGEEGFFLSAGDFWQKSSIAEAHIHTPTEVEVLRGTFLHHKRHPQRMYLVKRVDGKPAIDTMPISFYLASSGSASAGQHFVGDCVQLAN
jgi:hypothetical protein